MTRIARFVRAPQLAAPVGGVPRRRRPLGAMCVIAAIVGAALSIAGRAASQTTALEVVATGVPRRVHGTDGREHIDYNLVLTNAFTAEVTLTSLVVRAGGKELLALTGEALAAAIRPLGIGQPTDRIPASSSVVAFVDIVLPAAARRRVPARLRHRITYTFAPGAPSETIIGSTTVRAPLLRVDRRRPIVVAPPLRGNGWLSGKACCDPSLDHRSIMLSANGTYVMPEMFAVDYIRVVDGRFYAGDGTRNTDWFGYGAPILAAKGGRVVSVVDDRPEVPPFIEDNPTVTRPSDYSGNGVVVEIRRGVFADYFHMQPGSVRVKVGQHVRTGQTLGLVGNSGNTGGPHLHFGINTGQDTFTSNSLPFVIRRFRFEGTAAPGAMPGAITVIGAPSEERRSHPLIGSVSDYSR